MRCIAIINQKGGVGKTTTCANLGAALALAGRRVVLVDLDPQANLTLHFGVDPDSQRSSYSLLSGTTTFADTLSETGTENLRLLASHIDLSGAELELASAIGRETILLDTLRNWEREEREAHGRAPADYVLFDCPPSLGLLSINALAAAREVLISLQTEFFALQGMSKLLEIVDLLKRRMNPDLVLTGILPCLYDRRLRLGREVLAEIREYFPEEVFKQAIRTNIKLAESPSYGQTIFEYAPESNGAEDYWRLALEVLENEACDPELAALPRPLATARVPVTSPAEAPGLASEQARDNERPTPPNTVEPTEPEPTSEEAAEPAFELPRAASAPPPAPTAPRFDVATILPRAAPPRRPRPTIRTGDLPPLPPGAFDTAPPVL